MLASGAVDSGFEPRSGQTKDYKYSICCFSAKNGALRSKIKDWLAQDQDICVAIDLPTDYCFGEQAL